MKTLRGIAGGGNGGPLTADELVVLERLATTLAAAALLDPVTTTVQ